MTVLLAGWTFLAWLPIVALVPMVVGDTRVLQLATGKGVRPFLERVRWLGERPASTILVNSAILGLEVASAILVFAWFNSSARRIVTRPSLRRRFSRRLTFMPPLVQGLGLLALPWLAGLASATFADRGGYGAIAVAPPLDLHRARSST